MPDDVTTPLAELPPKPWHTRVWEKLVSHNVWSSVIANAISWLLGCIMGFASLSAWNWLWATPIHGRVIDSETGEPVAQASIFTSDGAGYISDVTDESGAFELMFKEHKPQFFRPTIFNKYYEPLEDLFALKDRKKAVTIRLHAYAQKGFVKDSSGKPVAEATVSVAKRSTLTDAAGSFRLPISSQAVGATIRIAVKKTGRPKVERDIEFSRETPHTIILGDDELIGPQKPPLRLKSEREYARESWARVRDLIKKADERRALSGQEADAYELYLKAWNGIPDGNAPANNPVLQNEVNEALKEYQETNFKAASDRLFRVMKSIPIPH